MDSPNRQAAGGPMTSPVPLTFRRLDRSDFPKLARWQAQPHVSRWWGPPPDMGTLEKDYGPAIDGHDPTEFFIAELGGVPIGLVQRYRNRDDQDWDQQIQLPRAAGIDYYIGEPQLIGRGLGPQLIAQFVQKLFDDFHDVDTVSVGVLEGNRASSRALGKAGFRRLRSQFLESDEPWDRGAGYVYVQTRSERRK